MINVILNIKLGVVIYHICFYFSYAFTCYEVDYHLNFRSSVFIFSFTICFSSIFISYSFYLFSIFYLYLFVLILNLIPIFFYTFIVFIFEEKKIIYAFYLFIFQVTTSSFYFNFIVHPISNFLQISLPLNKLDYIILLVSCSYP